MATALAEVTAMARGCANTELRRITGDDTLAVSGTSAACDSLPVDLGRKVVALRAVRNGE